MQICLEEISYNKHQWLGIQNLELKTHLCLVTTLLMPQIDLRSIFLLHRQLNNVISVHAMNVKRMISYMGCRSYVWKVLTDEEHQVESGT